MDEKAIERFWAKVRRGAPDECWPWLAGVDKDGYGKFKMPNGSHVRSNRGAFFIEHGHWPVFACHTCDTPGCCNPLHVFDGSPQDNVADMVQKHRQAHGERSSLTYLTPNVVLAIRASPLSPRAAATHFQTSKPNIYAIRQRRTWKHL